MKISAFMLRCVQVMEMVCYKFKARTKKQENFAEKDKLYTYYHP